MSSVDRRSFLTAAVAAPVAMTATPSTAGDMPAPAGITDQHPKWLAQFLKTERELLIVEEGSEADKRLWSKRMRLEGLICQTPATSFEGLAAQLEFLIDDARDYWGCENHQFHAERALESVRMLAGGEA